MLKKLLVLAVAGVAAKVIVDKLNSRDEADLWAEATDTVRPGR
ncbi:MAG TPA: DLW-39 family protein [Nocardioidaceae bacterium]|nr:DLW-39 family protein [Nocardioidaceae bacterium]